MAWRQPRLGMIKGLCRLLGGLVLRLLLIASIIALGLYLDKLFEALLVLVMAAQFELAYRQYWYGRVRDEPKFSVEIVGSFGVEFVGLMMKNVGLTPAYLISVSRVLCRDKPLPPEEWSNHIINRSIPCLEPSASATLVSIHRSFFEEMLVKGGCTLEVSYFNVFSRWRSFYIKFYKYTPMVIVGVERPPGLLLSIPEYVALLRAYIALHGYKKMAWKGKE